MTADNPFEPYDAPRLTIELVPMGQWFDNVRARFSDSQWNTLKRACFTYAHHRCEICGGVGKKHPVECHEIWHYDDDSKTQTLKGLISLCPPCHRVKHIGNAQRMGLLAPTIKHMAKINKWPLFMAEAYVEVEMDRWQWRSQFDWSLDLSWLDNADAYVKSAANVDQEQRREARKTLASDVLQSMTRKRSAQEETRAQSAPSSAPGFGSFS